jgi:hypothetical protein
MIKNLMILEMVMILSINIDPLFDRPFFYFLPTLFKHIFCAVTSSPIATF